MLDVQQLKGQCEASTVFDRQVAACLEDRKDPSLSPGQDNSVNKYAITIHKNTRLIFDQNLRTMQALA